jgi:hypothetical protein
MNTLSFAGQPVVVQSVSPHGNYVVLQLNERLTVCGTFFNTFHWEESPDADSGFVSFILYLGLASTTELEHWLPAITEAGGYCKPNEDQPRPAKRVQAFPYELKVRGLTPQAVVQLAQRS